VTWTEVNAGEELDEEMRKRLEELGYVDGGHVYRFLTARPDLDSILDDIENETGLSFRGGEDGHASLEGNVLKITSKEEIPEAKVEGIEKIC